MFRRSRPQLIIRTVGEPTAIGLVVTMAAVEELGDFARSLTRRQCAELGYALGNIVNGINIGAGRFDANPTGVGLIARERARQVRSEGWTPAHDDEHDRFELSRAAKVYVSAARAVAPGTVFGPSYFDGDEAVIETFVAGKGWPWHRSWFKPSADPVRNLAKAGALIAAEMDRLLRGRRLVAEPTVGEVVVADADVASIEPEPIPPVESTPEAVVAE